MFSQFMIDLFYLGCVVLKAKLDRNFSASIMFICQKTKKVYTTLMLR